MPSVCDSEIASTEISSQKGHNLGNFITKDDVWNGIWKIILKTLMSVPDSDEEYAKVKTVQIEQTCYEMNKNSVN